jgi:hypothetical protein
MPYFLDVSEHNVTLCKSTKATVKWLVCQVSYSRAVASLTYPATIGHQGYETGAWYRYSLVTRNEEFIPLLCKGQDELALTQFTPLTCFK